MLLQVRGRIFAGGNSRPTSLMKQFHPPGLKRARAKAFSLVELALALGVMAFAMAGIVGLIPFGLTSFRQAMNNTVESGIIQSLTNEIFLSEFANLRSMAKSGGKIYYYDAAGDPVDNAEEALYTAEVSFTDLKPSAPQSSDPLASLTHGAGSTALITITRLDKSKTYFTVIVGNNKPVDANETPATW